jgi:uncharacterized protein (TIGR02172 family)
MDYKNIDISSWIQEGEGGMGKTYSHPDAPGVMLKVNKTSILNDEAAMRREVETAQHVLALGLTTPRMYEIVRVGDCFGMTFERIQGKRSLARICADEPSRIAEAAALLAAEGKQLHATPCDTAFFPSRKELALKAIDTACFVYETDKQKMKSFVEGLSDETTCVHGDMQMGNLIVSGEGKPYWIDLGWFSYGSPFFDIGHLYLLCNVYSQFQGLRDITHMTQEQMLAFWDAFATAYSGSADHADFDARAAKFAPLDECILSYHIPRPSAHQMFAHVVHSFVEKYY